MNHILALIGIATLAFLSVACGVPGATPTPDVIVPLTVARKTPTLAATTVMTASVPVTAPVTVGAPPTPKASNATPAPVVTLPVPQVYAAKLPTQIHGWVQITLPVFEAAPADAALEATMRYVVLKVTFKNISATAHDAIGLPFSVGIGTEVTQSDLLYYSQPYGPGTNLWTQVDKLSTTSTKKLAPGQSLTGALYFQIPASATSAYVVWKPVAQAQYIWPPQNLPPQVMSK